MGDVNRRNDIGSKVLISVVALLTITIVSFSIGAAGRADSKANQNKISITRVETTQLHIQSDIKEIKGDVKEIKRAVVK